MSNLKVKLIEERFEEVGEKLKKDFVLLEKAKNRLIEYCKLNSRVLFIEHNRFSKQERSLPDAEKLEIALTKVLSLEYENEKTIIHAPGSTETFHAVIALPQEARELLDEVNKLKKSICDIFKETTDSRVKVNGTWSPVNKQLLKLIGYPRANLKQIRRKINIHEDNYDRISLSATWQKPIYRKTYSEVVELLAQYTSIPAQIDMQKLAKLKNHSHFAMFYDAFYTSMDGNFKYKNDIAEQENKKYLTQKISSPIYILCDDVKKINLEIRHKVNQQKSSRVSPDIKVNPTQVLTTLPIYTYQ